MFSGGGGSRGFFSWQQLGSCSTMQVSMSFSVVVHVMLHYWGSTSLHIPM